MTKEDAINKIKQLLSFSTEIVQPTQFVDVKTIEGEILRTTSEELKVGDKVTLVSEAGETDVEAGTSFTLEDGSVLTVGEGSLISELTPATEEVISEDMAEDTIETVDETEPVSVVDETEENTSNIEGRVGQLEELIKELINNQNKNAEATFSLVQMLETFSKMPIEDNKIKDLRTTFSSTIINEKQDPQSVRERNLLAIREVRSSKK